MTHDQILRAGARAALVAAAIGIPADLYHFTIDDRASASQSLAFRFHSLGLILAFTLSLLALAAIVVAQGGRAGRLGRLGALSALLGSALVLGDLAKEGFALPLAPAQLAEPQGYYLAVVIVSFVLLAVGWILTGVAARRTGLIGGRAMTLLVIGALLAVPPIPGAYVTLLVGIAVAAREALHSPAAGRPAAVASRPAGAIA